MRLAALFGVTVAQLLDSMSSSEFSEWIAFEREYGLPDIYFLTSKLVPAVLAPYSKEPVRPQDVVPYYKPTRQPQTVADHKRLLRSISRKRV